MRTDLLLAIAAMEKPHGFRSPHKAVLLAMAAEADEEGIVDMNRSEIATEAWIWFPTAERALNDLQRASLVSVVESDDLGFPIRWHLSLPGVCE